MIHCSFQSGRFTQMWVQNMYQSGNGRAGFFGIAFIMSEAVSKSFDLFPDDISTGSDSVMENQHPCYHVKSTGTLLFTGKPTGDTKRVVLTTDDSLSNSPFDNPVIQVSKGTMKQWYTHLVPFMAPVQAYYDFRLPNTVDYTAQGYGLGGWSNGDYYDTVAYYSYWLHSGGKPYVAYNVTCMRMEFSPNRKSFRKSVTTTSIGVWSVQSLDSLYSRVKTVFSYPSGAWSSVSTQCIDLDFAVDTSFPDKDVIEDTITQSLEQLAPPRVDWGEMSYRCASQVQTWGANGIALSKDLLGIRGELKSMLKLIGDIENPKKWASAYLSYKYGLRLTVADMASLLKTHLAHYNHVGPAKVSSSSSGLEKGGWSWTAHYGIYYRQYDDLLSQLYYQADSFDLMLTRKNAWDFVPFSFVLDWIIDVGGYFDRLDACDRLSHYELLGAIGSIKKTVSFTASKLGFQSCSGSIDFTVYDRFVSPEVEPPRIKVDTPINQGFDHYVEAAALVVQRILK